MPAVMGSLDFEHLGTSVRTASAQSLVRPNPDLVGCGRKVTITCCKPYRMIGSTVPPLPGRGGHRLSPSRGGLVEEATGRSPAQAARPISWR